MLKQARDALAGGRVDVARTLIDRALTRAPRRVDLLLARAHVLLAAGDKVAATAGCRDVLSRDPDSTAALNLLGESLRGTDDSAAEAAWRRAVDLAPRNAEALFHLGNMSAERGDHAQAVGLLERALRLAPGNPSLLINLGVQYDNVGRIADAERCYREVLGARPSQLEALANLAQLLFTHDRFAEALPVYDRLVAVAPAAPAQIWNNRGVCQAKAGQSEDAARSFRRALALEPDSPQVLANLGFLLYQRHDHEEARSLLLRAHHLDPGRLQVAAFLFDLDLQFADWTDFESQRQALTTSVTALAAGSPGVVPPFAFMSVVDDPALQLAAAKSVAWLARDAGQVAVPDLPAHSASPPRLRLGFVSTVFHEHPVPRLIVDLLERLDRNRFDVCAYQLAPAANDAMRLRVTAAATMFRDFSGCSTADIVAQIRADHIDMLFDLAGHTEHARPELFAARPAPVQVNYLGHAGTLGAPYYDCILTDAFVAPLAEQPHFTERLVHVADCYLPCDPQRVLAEPVPSRREYGLPEDAFIFVSQAAPFKILPPMFDAWMRLLAQVTDGVLWLRPMPRQAVENLRLEARRRGIEEARIMFAPPESLPRYLARFRLADLYLDTYPFGSHTTVNDALYAGLPVITLAGRSMAARASASQVHATGLGELVAASLEEYEAMALGLAQNGRRLDEITTRLRTIGRGSSLFDMHAYAARFERALLQIWEEWQSGGDERLPN